MSINDGNGLVLIGAGDHARVILSLLKSIGIKPQYIVDDDESTHGTEVNGIPIVGSLSQTNLAKSCLIAIGDNQIRKAIDKKLSNRAPSPEYRAFVHPTAIVNESVSIGEGSVVMAGAVIQSGAKIGRHVIVNSGAVIDHDCLLSDYSHVGSNSTLAGGVSLEEGVFVGAGAVVIDHKKVGAWTKIGAAACVIKDIPSFCTAVGVPAKPVRFHND